MDNMGNRVHKTLPPENDEGDIEYKWSLAKMDSYKRNKITSQMRWRVKETSDQQSALYILGVHDNGQLTGLPLNNLVDTYVNLMECANRVGLYTCILYFKKNPAADTFWAILQVFECSLDKGDVHDDSFIPKIPYHVIPEYLDI